MPGCQRDRVVEVWRSGTALAEQLLRSGRHRQPATGMEDLRGADPDLVRFENGVHGAIFATPAAGVEAHIQHLYAYACKDPLPAGKTLVDPRFCTGHPRYRPQWTDLNGRWAVPGAGYGESILLDYYYKAFDSKASSGSANRNNCSGCRWKISC